MVFYTKYYTKLILRNSWRGERDLKGLYFTVFFYAYAVLINVDEPLLVLVMTIPQEQLTTFTPRI